MRVVMTLLVKDEADIIDAQIAFHLAAGVDFVIATDHESRDDTVAILERYAAQGVLHLLRESGDVFSSVEVGHPNGPACRHRVRCGLGHQLRRR